MDKRIIKVSPSIAAGDLMDLRSEVKKLEQSGADAIHFDCMDGHFVPLLTIGVPFVEQMRKMTSMHLDVHIMVTNPDHVFMDYINAGADTLSFPIETAVHAHRICAKIKENGKRVGVVLNPATPISMARCIFTEIDCVNIMTVNPGFSRQNHLEFVHSKIAELYEIKTRGNFKFEIQVDGGVNEHNISKLYRLGVDNVVAGGSVFGSDDYATAVAKLKKASAN